MRTVFIGRSELLARFVLDAEARVALEPTLDEAALDRPHLIDEQAVDEVVVLVLHGAITEARKSHPVLNLISTVYPAALVISYGKQLITGTGTGVGDVRVEAELLDGQTGQRMAAAVDERAGTKALRTKFDGTWGDLKLAFDWWSARFVERIELLKKGDFSDKSL